MTKLRVKVKHAILETIVVHINHKQTVDDNCMLRIDISVILKLTPGQGHMVRGESQICTYETLWCA